MFHWKRIRRYAAIVGTITVLLVCLMAQVTLKSAVADWEGEFLRYALNGHNLGNDVSAITGMSQFTAGTNNGYMEAEVSWNGPLLPDPPNPDPDQGTIELILSINYPEHNRFDISIWMWENGGGDFVFGFNHGWANRYHRLMWQITRMDAHTLNVKIWDCDDGDDLLFSEDVIIEQEHGVGHFEGMWHSSEYWEEGFDAIGYVEGHTAYDPGTGWVDFNDMTWNISEWQAWDVTHLYGNHDWTHHTCDPNEALRVDPTPPSSDPTDKPRYSGDAVHDQSPSLDRKTAGSNPLASKPDSTYPGPGSKVPDYVTRSICGASREEASEDWSRTLFWHLGNAPTSTPTNTPTPTPTATPIPTCTPYLRPTLPPSPSLDINVDQAWPVGAHVRWWAGDCDGNSIIRLDWRAPGTPCPPLGIVWIGSSRMGDDLFEYYSGVPGPPYGNKRACASIWCLIDGTPAFDTSVKYLQAPPICTDWWEERVQMYHPQGRGDLGCY